MPLPDLDFLNDDRYNKIEAALVLAFKANSWLGNKDNVGLIHEKLREDFTFYKGPELPAIAIEVSEIPQEETRNQERFLENVTLEIEVIAAHASRQQNNDDLKKIVAYIRNWFRYQMNNFSYDDPFLGDHAYTPKMNLPAEFATTKDDDGNAYEVAHTYFLTEITNMDEDV